MVLRKMPNSRYIGEFSGFYTVNRLLWHRVIELCIAFHKSEKSNSFTALKRNKLLKNRSMSRTDHIHVKYKTHQYQILILKKTFIEKSTEKNDQIFLHVKCSLNKKSKAEKGFKNVHLIEKL